MADKTNANIGFEKQLWDAACVLWGHIPAAEYRKVIIGLIFLRYISAAFDKRYQELVEEGDGFEYDRDAYTIVYFDARAKLHLQEYLDSRTDDNPALFVSLRAPHKRIQIGGIEHRLRKMGKRLNIQKVHPHKFRRTLATMAIDKGMPIEQLQRLLGHQRIDTTLQYAMVKQSNVKTAHRKYIG